MYFILVIKAELSASLLQSSASHDPSEIILMMDDFLLSYYQCWKLLCGFIYL